MKKLPTSRTMVLAMCAAWCLPGCVDDAAQERAETQALIAEQTNTLRNLSLTNVDPTDPSADAVRGTLRGVLSALKSGTGGEKGQQAASAMLASAAHRDLAGLDLKAIAQLEAKHRRQRSSLHAKLDAVLRYETTAMGRSQVSVDSERNLLERDAQEARDWLSDSSDRASELNEPIRSTQADIDTGLKEVGNLESQAADLRRQYSELGPAAGFTYLRQAVDLERRADQLRFQVAQREIDLGYELESEHSLANDEAKYAQSAIDSIQSSMTQLDDMAQHYQDSADQDRNEAATLVSAITNKLDAMASERADLQSLTDNARSNLEQSASLAQQAAGKLGREGGATARMAAARAHEELGRLASLELNRSRELIGLLERMVDAGIGNTADHRNRLTEATTVHDEALESAKASLQEASSIAGQISTGDGAAGVQQYKASIDAALARLSGSTAPTASISLNTGSSGSASSPTPAPTGNTADGGPEALLARLQAIYSSDANIIEKDAQAAALTYYEDDRLEQLVGNLQAAMNPIASALIEQFGNDASTMFETMAKSTGALPDYTAARITNVSDDRVTMTYPRPGGSANLEMINVDGEWFIMPMIPAGMSAMQYRAMLDQQLTAIEANGPALVRRIKDGEFSSPMEALGALMQPGK